MSRLADPARRNRALWAVPCWFIAVMTIGLGTPYAIGGQGAVPLPSAYEAVQRTVPGGMHTYGVIIAAYGLVLAEALIQPVHHQRMRDKQIFWTLVMFVPFALGAVSGFVASWVLVGVKSWQFILFWSALAALAAGTVWFRPDTPTDAQPTTGVERVA